jgi:modulator of FtsH protease HflC
MNPVVKIIGIVLVVVVGFATASSLFVVRVTDQAIVLRFGEYQETVSDAGLHWKWPFVDEVTYMDKRVLPLDLPTAEVIASDDKRLEVDAMVRYKIVDPLKFFRTVQGDERIFNSQLSTTTSSNLRQVLGRVPFDTLLSDQRIVMMNQIRDLVEADAETYGVKIVDVRIKRADLPQQVSSQVFIRMQTEFKVQATERREKGREIAAGINAQAEKEREVILAEARRDGEIIRGQGDAESVKLFAEAFGRDVEFFEFYRSMQAYSKAIGSEDTLVLSPDSEFFKYLNQRK